MPVLNIYVDENDTDRIDWIEKAKNVMLYFLHFYATENDPLPEVNIKPMSELYPPSSRAIVFHFVIPGTKKTQDQWLTELDDYRLKVIALGGVFVGWNRRYDDPIIVNVSECDDETCF